MVVDDNPDEQMDSQTTSSAAGSEKDEFPTETIDKPVDQNLLAFGDSGKAPAVRGCINYALYRNCFKGSECKNAAGHNEKVAEETRKWMISKLQQDNGPKGPIRSTPGTSGERNFDRPPNPNAFPRKIVQREKPRQFE